jgi:hypothetical protein
MSDQNASLRKHLVELLKGGSAHIEPRPVLEGLPFALQGVVPERAEHSPWQVLEHLRLAQSDILEFSRSKDHVSPPWPEGYWPTSATPPDEQAWDRSVEMFFRDLQATMDLVADPASDLFTPFPWGKGQTLLREALLIADHNSHHLGQLILLRRLLGAWPPKK